MADRTEAQRSRGNGSVAQTTDLGVPVAAEFVHSLEGLALARSVAALTQRLNRLTQEVAESPPR